MIEKILNYKRVSVAQREREFPLAQFKHTLTLSDRNFEQALRTQRPAFILECKKASPSQGLIRPEFNIVEIAKEYGKWASAVSVLTDERFFQGSLDNLVEARQELTCPILCKDFIVSTYQVYEACRYGADAILLMLSVVDDELYAECAQIAQELGMGVLTEVRSNEELNRAIALGAKIIGINNRDFKTLKVDLDVSRQMMSKVPSDRLLVVESGISNHDDIVKYGSRPDGFLIGTTLMRQPRLDLAVREMIFGRVKVCGLTSVADAKMVYDEGAVWGGLIFTPVSPRAVDLATAEQMTNSVPLQWVGVFVNQDIELVSEMACQLKLSAVQLHGDEDANYIKKLKEKLPSSVEIWKVVRMPNSLPRGEGFRILLDTYDKNLVGGTGKTFDWSLIDGDKNKLILSGGVSPDNACAAQRIGTWAIDVNSGVEERPGIKSREKIHQLFQNIRGNQV